MQKNIAAHTQTYRHKLSAGADKLSEAQQEVLFGWENLGQLEGETTGNGSGENTRWWS